MEGESQGTTMEPMGVAKAPNYFRMYLFPLSRPLSLSLLSLLSLSLSLSLYIYI